MSSQVLLLDASWRVDRVIGVERACELLVARRAVAASPDVAMVMRSPSTEIEIPEVVARVAGGVCVATWRPPICSARRVRQRDGHVCQFVIDGEPCSQRGDSVDHLRPRSLGGPDSWQNLVAACRRHNHTKDDRTLEEMSSRHGWSLRREPFVPTRDEMLLASLGSVRRSWEPFVSLPTR